MKRAKHLAVTITLALLPLGCFNAVRMPSVHEPLDSTTWQECAGELKERQSISMIDDLTLDSKTLICQAVVAAKDGETEEALELLTEAGVRSPEDHRPHYIQGRILAEAGRYEEALAAFERSLKRFESLEPPTERLGRQLLKKEDEATARRFLELADERELCPYGCLGLMAQLQHKTGDAHKAEATYGRMIEIDPEEPAAYVGLAAMKNAEGAYAREAEMLEKATKKRGFTELTGQRKGDIYYSLAFAYYNAENYSRATASIDAANKLHPGQATWHLLAGWIYLKQDQYQQALDEFGRAKTLNRELSAAGIGMADALLGLGQNERAREALEKALAGDDQNTVIMVKLSYVNALLGDYTRAEGLLNEAARIDGDNLPGAMVTKIRLMLKKQAQNP